MAEAMTPESREADVLARLEALTEEVAQLRGRVDTGAVQGEEPLSPDVRKIQDLLETAGKRVADLWNRGLEKVGDPSREAVGRVESALGESPLATAALAFGAGLLLGALMRRR